MSIPLSNTSVLQQPRVGLPARLLLAVALLVTETLLAGLIETPALGAPSDAAALAQSIQHWVFRFAIAYAGSFVILLYLRGSIANMPLRAKDAPLRIAWILVHFALLIPFAWLSTLLYSGGTVLSPALAVGRLTCGLAAAMALFAGIAPRRVWVDALRQTGALPIYSLLPAAGALLAFKLSQMLWTPAATLTFRLVSIMVHPLMPSLRIDASTQTLIAEHFAVQVWDVCSGLEGVGLMLAFCTAWLWYFRRQYIFPRALIIVPIAVLLIFLLNSVRIAALLLIGNAGYEKIAMVGFHSQAGWMAFNLAAFGVAYVAKSSAWLHRAEHPPDAEAHDATAAYLMPLLAILAAGMLAHAVSGGFDFLYPLRFVCAAAALWAYRRSYGTLDWRFSWRGVLTGVAIFGVWGTFVHFVSTPAAMPDDLARLSGPARGAWIGCRAAAAIITVPIAEELAYRGFLMRRIVSSAFDSIDLRSVRWPAIVISAAVFGMAHGGLWVPGIVAGLAFAVLVVKTGKIGESIAAHATSNALIAISVLFLDQWQLW